MLNPKKCAIIGCGFVGSTTAYTLMQSALFSEMVLIDLDRKKAEGEAADIGHGIPFHSPMEIYAGDYPDLSDASIVILAAGGGQKPGQTRLDLVRSNTRIFQSIVEKIVSYNRECILLVVTNPVDILTYATMKFSGFPPHRVIGSGTVLDTARLKYLLGSHLGVDFRNVHSFIIGEHGDSELPVWSDANVSGIDLDSFCESSQRDGSEETLNSLFLDVKNSAYRIIENKGATYYAIAEAVRKIVSAILRDENAILPVSTLVCGHYGLSNVALSVPCVLGREGIKEILDIPLNEREATLLRASAEKLGSVLDELGFSSLCPISNI
ncbi:MAG: L-lactate dehydrogenase [Clostridia bacterium]|nr:L-lactate dehydrogenase [Clostridia bacterium]